MSRRRRGSHTGPHGHPYDGATPELPRRAPPTGGVDDRHDETQPTKDYT
ncbi:hypothetical protein SCWH03_06100 [Streptomyces pacificus]|uniref:Uncharacterized protein n=1 Tax=Streptomyces pacificus TaxID=2705029 RepID=A0A6A0AN68_9ACTN|nr:hypothetical protein SCWH03_06100 [Streptomyces pacificus]